MNDFQNQMMFYNSKKIVQSKESKTKQQLVDMEHKNQQLKSHIQELQRQIEKQTFGEKKKNEIESSIKKDWILQNIEVLIKDTQRQDESTKLEFKKAERKKKALEDEIADAASKLADIESKEQQMK